MNVSIKNPDLLNILDEVDNKTYFGADQVWYENDWNKRAGCGPTCAANITAYLALTREECRKLYSPKSFTKNDFAHHMDELFLYVTPGAMGVNSVDKFTDGFSRFLADKDVKLQPHVLSVDMFFKRKRDPKDLIEFLNDGLKSDCPIAFLNLSRGEEKKLQAWHWITITGAYIENNRLIAVASDEGNQIEFDVQLWYLTTKLHGGFIYYK